ncbi:RNA exonuclease 4-like protein [Corchorus olitorius]|uniref:RNA exonuclease 4-like protein n=1 Tax=Corchorus olitorius TaxID=93759 RepID=A0A1R3HGU1_9ROSI|nr:RNA exonuclease 4-like protein [Corchorus olitorius]
MTSKAAFKTLMRTVLQASMRLYLRMRNQYHRREDYPLASDPQNRNNFALWMQSELERIVPTEEMPAGYLKV